MYDRIAEVGSASWIWGLRLTSGSYTILKEVNFIHQKDVFLCRDSNELYLQLKKNEDKFTLVISWNTSEWYWMIYFLRSLIINIVHLKNFTFTECRELLQTDGTKKKKKIKLPPMINTFIYEKKKTLQKCTYTPHTPLHLRNLK